MASTTLLRGIVDLPPSNGPLQYLFDAPPKGVIFSLLGSFFSHDILTVLVSAAVEYAGKFVTGQGFVTKYKPTHASCAKRFNDEVLPLVAKATTKLEEEFQKIVYAHDIETTLKAAGISYVIYKLTSLISFFNLIATAVVLAFTIPGIYLQNKTEIDNIIAELTAQAKAQLSVASKKANEYTANAQEKAAPFVNDLVKKTGPVGSFIQSKFPTRTAGSTVGDSRASTFGTKADAPSTASTTGASKFPDVPTDLKSTVHESAQDIKVPVPEPSQL